MIKTQIEDAYRDMVKQARYHPMAPGDGMGGVYKESIDVPTQAAMYAAEWWKRENTNDFHLGCPSHEGRMALIFAVEGAKAICGVDYALAEKVLKMATAEIHQAALKLGPDSHI